MPTCNPTQTMFQGTSCLLGGYVAKALAAYTSPLQVPSPFLLHSGDLYRLATQAFAVLSHAWSTHDHVCPSSPAVTGFAVAPTACQIQLVHQTGKSGSLCTQRILHCAGHCAGQQLAMAVLLC